MCGGLKFYSKSSEEVAKELDVEISKGMSNEEVAERKEKYGKI